MKLRKFSIVLLAAAICFALAPVGASADPSAAAVLSPVASVKQGGTVTISGTSALDEVIIKVLRPDNAGIVYYDIAKVTDGRFAASFTLLASEPAGTYQVIAGQASQVSSRELVVQAADVVVPPTNPPVDPGPIVGPGGGGGGGGGAPAAGSDLSVTIGGSIAGSVAAAKTSEQNGKTTVTVTVDAQKLSAGLANAGDKPSVVIPVTSASDRTSVVLTGDAVKALENKNAVLEIQTPNGSYKLPASELLIEQLAGQLGAQAKLSDIVIQVDIAKSGEAAAQLLESAASKGEFTVVVPPVDFTVTASYGGQTVSVTRFQAFVEREIPLPASVDASRVTTAVVLNEDGTARSVPTKIVMRDGVSYAIVNSLTNSTYSLIWNPVAFGDMEGHWAKQAVNDMGSRMIISGIGGGRFSPDRDITRAEFAAILVRALGLKPEIGGNAFADVQASAWYGAAVQTAYASGLISGFEDGTFRPQDKITREQAMVIVAKAMGITGLTGKLPAAPSDRLLSAFADRASASSWAKAGIAGSLQAGIVSGRGERELAPQANVTRAETAVLMQKLLQKSELI